MFNKKYQFNNNEKIYHNDCLRKYSSHLSFLSLFTLSIEHSEAVWDKSIVIVLSPRAT